MKTIVNNLNNLNNLKNKRNTRYMLTNLITTKPILANIITGGSLGLLIASILQWLNPVVGFFAAVVFLLIALKKLKQQTMLNRITEMELQKLQHKIHQKK